MSSAIQSKITKLREQMELLEAIDRAIEIDPEVRALVMEAVSDADAKSGKKTKAPAPGTHPEHFQSVVAPGSAIEKLLSWFKRVGNIPSTVAEMTAGASISAASVRQIVYTKHKDKFEPMGKRVETRESLFRAREGVQQ